jgi:hypothetical protein
VGRYNRACSCSKGFRSAHAAVLGSCRPQTVHLTYQQEPISAIRKDLWPHFHYLCEPTSVQSTKYLKGLLPGFKELIEENVAKDIDPSYSGQSRLRNCIRRQLCLTWMELMKLYFADNKCGVMRQKACKFWTTLHSMQYICTQICRLCCIYSGFVPFVSERLKKIAIFSAFGKDLSAVRLAYNRAYVWGPILKNFVCENQCLDANNWIRSHGPCWKSIERRKTILPLCQMTEEPFSRSITSFHKIPHLLHWILHLVDRPTNPQQFLRVLSEQRDRIRRTCFALGCTASLFVALITWLF